MKCPEGLLACDMFLSSSPSSNGVGNRNRRVAVVVASSIPAHTSLLSAPATLNGRRRDTRTGEGVWCVRWVDGGGIVIVSIILFFFQPVFRPLFFLIKTSALDRVFVCAKKDNYYHYFQS